METHESSMKIHDAEDDHRCKLMRRSIFELALKLNTLDSMNYEKNNTMKSSFWIEKLRKYPQKMIKTPEKSTN